MTCDEALKLIGGYATNTLTPEERAALFQAALEDPEIFDALQSDQALRELLDDGVSRGAILHALEKSFHPAWYRNWWRLGTVAGAAAVTVLLILLIPRMTNPAAPLPRPIETASVAKPRAAIPRPEAPATRPAPRPKRHAPPPAAPSPEAAAATPHPIGGIPAASGGFAGGAFQVHSGRNTRLFMPMRPGIRYEILRRAASGAFQPLEPGALLQNGDAIRLQVTPPTAGRLAVYQTGASGQQRLLYPDSEPGIEVFPRRTYVVPPDAFIEVQKDARLKLVLSPAPITTEAPLR